MSSGMAQAPPWTSKTGYRSIRFGAFLLLYRKRMVADRAPTPLVAKSRSFMGLGLLVTKLLIQIGLAVDYSFDKG